MNGAATPRFFHIPPICLLRTAWISHEIPVGPLVDNDVRLSPGPVVMVHPIADATGSTPRPNQTIAARLIRVSVSGKPDAARNA